MGKKYGEKNIDSIHKIAHLTILQLKIKSKNLKKSIFNNKKNHYRFY